MIKRWRAVVLISLTLNFAIPFSVYSADRNSAEYRQEQERKKAEREKKLREKEKHQADRPKKQPDLMEQQLKREAPKKDAKPLQKKTDLFERMEQKDKGLHKTEPSVAKPAARSLDTTRQVRLRERMKIQPSVEQRAQAMKLARDQRSFYKKSSPYRYVATPFRKTQVVSMQIAPKTYYYRRGILFETYGYEPPVYVYEMHPYYGVWDGVWLGFAAQRAAYDPAYAAFFYHHKDDDDIIAWRRDAETIAPQSEEFQETLEQLDVQVASLEENETPVFPTYVPEESGDAALAPEFMDQVLEKMNDSQMP